MLKNVASPRSNVPRLRLMDLYQFLKAKVFAFAGGLPDVQRSDRREDKQRDACQAAVRTAIDQWTYFLYPAVISSRLNRIKILWTAIASRPYERNLQDARKGLRDRDSYLLAPTAFGPTRSTTAAPQGLVPRARDRKPSSDSSVGWGT